MVRSEAFDVLYAAYRVWRATQIPLKACITCRDGSVFAGLAAAENAAAQQAMALPVLQRLSLAQQQQLSPLLDDLQCNHHAIEAALRCWRQEVATSLQSVCNAQKLQRSYS